jgi:hypothetical protein
VLGLFEGHGDIGSAQITRSVEYDAAKMSYLVSGGGENMSFTTLAITSMLPTGHAMGNTCFSTATITFTSCQSLAVNLNWLKPDLPKTTMTSFLLWPEPNPLHWVRWARYRLRKLFAVSPDGLGS